MLALFDYQLNNIRFENRNGRVWVNLTDMAKASGKLFGNWNQLSTTKELLQALEPVIGIPITDNHNPFSSLISVVQGIGVEQGTWAIEEVALEFAGWCSVPFKIWMLVQIKTLIKEGTVSLQQPKLSANKQALQIARDIREITDALWDNPRLAQFLIDHSISEIMPSAPILMGDRLRGVVEIAEEMKLPVNMKNRSQLGRFVKQVLSDFAQSEERLVNGTMRQVCVYPDNEKTRETISNFFNN